MNMNMPASLSHASIEAQPTALPGFSAMVLEALTDAVIVVGTTESIRYMNPAGKRLLGCTHEEAYGRPLNSCLVLKDGATGNVMSSPMACLLARDPHRRGQHDLLVDPDGREIPVESTVILLYDKWDRVAGSAIILHETSQGYTTIQQLREEATLDHLTRLLNRVEFERRLAQCMDRIRKAETHALLYLDLDGFKIVNDCAGHAAGDAALRLVARVFKDTIRKRDTLARIGGDEFGLLLEHCPFEIAMQHAEELQNALKRTEFQWEERHFRLGVSIGLAMISGETARGMRDYLMEAEMACYAAKHSRRNWPRCHPLRKNWQRMENL